MFTQFKFDQSVKLLNKPWDGSRANSLSRTQARQYLNSWANHLSDYASKSPRKTKATKHLENEIARIHQFLYGRAHREELSITQYICENCEKNGDGVYSWEWLSIADIIEAWGWIACDVCGAPLYPYEPEDYGLSINQ